MPSKTSFCNGTEFRKCLSRWWPLWVIYGVILFIMLPGVLLNARSTIPYVSTEQISYLSNVILSETQMLLPLAVLYYKLNQFDKAEDCIKRLAKANKDTKKFLRAAARDQLDDYIGEMSPYGYRPFTMEELLDELMHTSYLFNSVPYFFAWASKVLAAKTSAKMSAGKPKLLH